MKHIAIFTLKDGISEKEFCDFYRNTLGKIPVVKKLTFFREVGTWSRFSYGMEILMDSADDWDEYTKHPNHDKAANAWKSFVTDWEEANLVEM